MKSPDESEFEELVELGATVGRALQEHGLLLAGAESCTGGLIGHILTETPGSSAWFAGAAVTYSYAAKVAVLGVRQSTLDAWGAVSSPCAAEMAEGARRLYGATPAYAVTGIAGPGGGSAEKPVGLTYLAVAGIGDVRIEKHIWTGSRSRNKLSGARAVLEMILRALNEYAAG